MPCPSCQLSYLLVGSSSKMVGRLPIELKCGDTICEQCLVHILKCNEVHICGVCHARIGPTDLSIAIRKRFPFRCYYSNFYMRHRIPPNDNSVPVPPTSRPSSPSLGIRPRPIPTSHTRPLNNVVPSRPLSTAAPPSTIPTRSVGVPPRAIETRSTSVPSRTIKTRGTIVPSRTVKTRRNGIPPRTIQTRSLRVSPRTIISPRPLQTNSNGIPPRTIRTRSTRVSPRTFVPPRTVQTRSTDMPTRPIQTRSTNIPSRQIQTRSSNVLSRPIQTRSTGVQLRNIQTRRSTGVAPRPVHVEDNEKSILKSTYSTRNTCLHCKGPSSVTCKKCKMIMCDKCFTKRHQHKNNLKGHILESIA